MTIEDGRAVEVRGDRDAPLFEGYICPKGRALPEIHANPKRLLHSLRRRPDGSHGIPRMGALPVAVVRVANRRGQPHA